MFSVGALLHPKCSLVRTGITSPSKVVQISQDGMAPSHWGGLTALLSPTELAGRGAGCARGDSPVPGEEEHSWAQLLGPQPSSGHCSSSSSICTEDFAASFWEGLVEPLLCQQEPAGDVPREGAGPGQDESLLPAGRSLDLQPQQGRAPGQDRSPSRGRRESLESLGARISHLSRVGVSWGIPWASPSAQPALGLRDPPRGDLLATALPGHSWRTPGVSAGRSRAGARTGSPGSSFLRANSARTRRPPALGMRRQEPPAPRGRAGNVTWAVGDTDREGADSSRSESGLPWSTGRCWGRVQGWDKQGKGHGRARDTVAGTSPSFLWGFCGLWDPLPQMPFSLQVLAQPWQPPGTGGHLCPQGTIKGTCPARYRPGLCGLGSGVWALPWAQPWLGWDALVGAGMDAGIPLAGLWRAVACGQDTKLGPGPHVPRGGHGNSRGEAMEKGEMCL